MFLSQAHLVPGMQVMGIAELEPPKVFEALERTGWDDGIAENAVSAGLINDAAARGRLWVVYSMAYGDQPALIMRQIDWARTVG
jgi:predicted homoserine dehydrogenase-like protein